MKYKNDPVKIEFASRGGDGPFGWSSNALLIKVFGKTVDTVQEEYIDDAEKTAEKWRQRIKEWK